MSDGPYNIVVDATAVTAMLGKAAEATRPAIVEELATVSELVAAEMKRRVNVGVGGDAGLRGSIGFKVVPATLTSEIKPSLPYGDALETGSRPHWVSAAPGSPLEQWAELKGLNVYAVQRSIATKGTMPHPYIQPTYDAMIPAVTAHFAASMAKLVDEVQV